MLFGVASFLTPSQKLLLTYLQLNSVHHHRNRQHYLELKLHLFYTHPIIISDRTVRSDESAIYRVMTNPRVTRNMIMDMYI